MFSINQKESTQSTGFKDMILNTLCAMIVIVVLLMALVNPVAKNDVGDIAQPGQMYVTLSWPGNNNVDVDLVVRDPSGEVVFFRHSHGRHLTLSKDDRGTLDDDTDLNFEYLFSRSLPDGYYTINAIGFGLNEGNLPVEVTLEVMMKDLKLVNKRSEKEIVAKKTINELYKEVTLTRFLVINGKIKKDSITNYDEDIIPILKFSDTEVIETPPAAPSNSRMHPF